VLIVCMMLAIGIIQLSVGEQRRARRGGPIPLAVAESAA
jgi:hypothetical protein